MADPTEDIRRVLRETAQGYWNVRLDQRIPGLTLPHFSGHLDDVHRFSISPIAMRGAEEASSVLVTGRPMNGIRREYERSKR